MVVYITRINNALEKIPQSLENHKQNFIRFQKELESAKEEAARPFPQEEELMKKSTRLAELNIQLDQEEKTEEQIRDKKIRKPMEKRLQKKQDKPIRKIQNKMLQSRKNLFLFLIQQPELPPKRRQDNFRLPVPVPPRQSPPRSADECRKVPMQNPPS